MTQFAPPPGYVPDQPQTAQQDQSTQTTQSDVQAQPVQSPQQPQPSQTTRFAPPPGYVPTNSIGANGAPAQSSQPNQSTQPNMLERAANAVGEFGAGIVPGAVEGMGTTIQSLPWIGKRIISPEDMAAERAYFAPGSKAEAAGQTAGGVGEGVLEFVLGDEALKGLSIADKIGIAGKIEQVAKDSPYIGALLRHGVVAARNGTVGTAEALAKGASLPEALKSGAETGLIGGTLGAAGELAETAPSAAGRAAARAAQTAGATGVAASGAAQAVSPRREGETDQQELERRISGAVQGLMGAESLTDLAPKIKEAAKNISEARTNKATSKIANEDFLSARKDIKMAIPSTKSTPYEPHDMDVAEAHLENHHETVEPIRNIKDVRDALDQSIRGIEDHISQKIGETIPNEPIATDVLDDVRSALSKNKREGFVDDGLKELKGYNLDNPTLKEADDIRRQLNLENKKALKTNDYDQAAARASDPGFAAREAAADSLREGIYKQLDNHGVEGTRDLRLEEGSLLKVRNAAQAQLQNGEKIVQGSSPSSTTRQVLAKTVKGTSTLAGAGTGAAVAGAPGAVLGAAAGGALGDAGANRIAAPDISRDALIERRMAKKVATYQPGQITVPNGIQSPPEEQPAPGTQGTLPIETKTPAASKISPDQASLFGQQSPYPANAALQSPQTELLSLQKTIRPLQAILNDPMAKSEDKIEAARRLAALPLSSLQNPTVKNAGPESRGAAAAKLPETKTESNRPIPKEIPTGSPEIDAAIKKGGAIPGGMMLGYVQFHDPITGSSLMLKPEDVSPESVITHMAVSRAKFGLTPDGKPVNK